MKQHNISRKLKSIALLTACVPAVSLMFSSCSDFLEIEPRNEIILEKFWNEKADVDGIVAGCYSGLQSEGCIKRMMIWGEARSENIAPGLNTNNDINLLNLLNENITATNRYTSWVDFYSIINRCNTVIKYAPEVAAIDPGYTQSELNATLAEMVGLRSLCYFYLIRTFRDVPYSTVAYTDDDQEMAMAATPFNQVLDSLINDLESVKDMAVKRYPTTEPLYQTGRITQDAIHAMLCEMYLWKQDYDRCIQYADLVIESKKRLAEEYQKSGAGSLVIGGGGMVVGGATGSYNERLARTNGYPLISDVVNSTSYGNAFNVLFTDDNNIEMGNQEIIFQLIFDDNPRGNSMIPNRAINDFYGNSTARGFLGPSDYVLEDIAKTSGRNIFEDVNKDVDARLYENANSLGTNKTIAKYVYTGIQIGSTTTFQSCTYFIPWTEAFPGSNWIIYRLSDIMLLKAEALAQKMQEGSDQAASDYNQPLLNEAFSLVNAINKRSVCQSTLKDTLVASDYATKSQMEDLIYRERQRELMFEGKRWYDLVRISRREGNTARISQAALRKVSSGSSLISNRLSKMEAIYLPYNNDEMKVNPFLVQNPAFSSGENSSYK